MTEEENILIDRYLSGDLPEEERKAFERLMVKDFTLLQRVSLRRNLTTYLSNEEVEVAELLALADRKHFEPDTLQNTSASRTSSNWWWLLLILLVLAGLGWFAMSQSAGNAPLAPPSESRSQMTLPTSKDTLVTSIPGAVTSPASSTFPVPATAPPKVNESQSVPAKLPEIDPISSPSATTDTAVFAQLDPADFTPYPMLEDMAGGQLRGGIDSTSLVLVPATDTIFLAALERTKMKGYSTVEPPYEVFIFDNQEQNFIEDRPVLRQRIEGAIQGDGYAFDVDLSTLTRSGRFYALVLDEEGELIMGKVIFVRQ